MYICILYIRISHHILRDLIIKLYLFLVIPFSSRKYFHDILANNNIYIQTKENKSQFICQPTFVWSSKNPHVRPSIQKSIRTYQFIDIATTQSWRIMSVEKSETRKPKQQIDALMRIYMVQQ